MFSGMLIKLIVVFEFVFNVWYSNSCAFSSGSYFTSDGSVAFPAGDILPSAIILRARSLFVFVQFDFGLRGENLEA